MGADVSPDEPSLEINYKVRTDGFKTPGLLRTETVNRQSTGGRRLHQVTLFYTGKEGSQPGDPTGIKLATYTKSRFSSGFYFEHAQQSWSGDLSDIRLLQTILNDKFPTQGRYQLLTGEASVDNLAKKILAGKLPIDSTEQILQVLVENPEAQVVFKQSDSSQILADAVNKFRQKQAIDNLETIAKDPGSVEANLQKILAKEWWIFGGRYIGIEKRRAFTVLDQLDLPLIRNDGSLHIVELKQAKIPKLIVNHRNHLAVGEEVSLAVSQAMNYLVGLDEQRAQILTDLKVDVRRATATIVVGHTDFVAGYTPEQVYETLRIYNSHLSRIEVVTYDELISGVRQSLDLAE